jgi:hypothetical protein
MSPPLDSDYHQNVAIVCSLKNHETQRNFGSLFIAITIGGLHVGLACDIGVISSSRRPSPDDLVEVDSPLVSPNPSKDN